MEYIIFCLVGAAGAFIRLLLGGKGLLLLPRVETMPNGSRHLNLGFISGLFIGAAAGWLAPSSLGMDSIVAFIAGYGGSDIIENLIERAKKLP